MNSCDIGQDWQYHKFIDTFPDGFPLEAPPYLTDLHDNTMAALTLVTDVPHHLHPYKLDIYTDGSHYQADREEEDAWGFAVLAEHQDGIALIGTLFHPVANSGNSCTDIECPSSTTSELAAIIWACIWLISRLDAIPAEIFADSTVAIGLTDRFFQSKVNHNIALLAAALLDIVRIRRTCTITAIIEHTGYKSHTGDPWNEYADALATHASHHHYSQLPLKAKENIFLSQGIQWAWLDPDNPDALAYPHIDENHFVITDYGSTAEPRKTFSSLAAKEATLTITFWQFNANTLAPIIAGTDDHGRFDILLAQLDKLEVLFGGFEEVRRSQYDGIMGKHYVITSAAIKGQFGMALACSLDTPYFVSPNKKQLFLKPKNFTVAHSGHKLLVVDCKAPLLELRLIVAHIPCSDADLADKQKAFREIEDYLKINKDCVIMIDANSRAAIILGHEKNAPTPIRQSAECFQKFLEDNQCYSPSLDDTYAKACEHTWTSSTNGHHTLDYIVFPKRWKIRVTDAYALDTDLIQMREDHRATLATTKIAATTVKIPTPWKQPRLDDAKLEDPVAVQNFKDDLNHASLPHWAAGADTHKDQLNLTVRNAALAHFRQSGPSKKNDMLSVEAWEVVLQRKNVKRDLCKLDNQRFSHRLSVVFYAWSSLAIYPTTLTPTQGNLSWLKWRQPILDRAIASLTAQHNRFTAAYKELSRIAKDSKLEDIANQVTDYTFANQSRKAWKGIKSLLALGGSAKIKGNSTYPELLDKNGNPTSSPEHAADTFLEHFAQLEIADVVDHDAVVKKHNDINSADKVKHKCNTPLSLHNVITKHMLEVSFNHDNPAKAGGIDGLTKQLTKVAPREMARHAHPYITKAALRCTEALEDKGGLAHQLYKKRGSHKLTSAFRIIMLENDIIKHHHRYLRSRLLTLAKACFLATQCGGMPNKCTAFANQLVRLAIQIAKVRKLVIILQFIDIRTAFYRVIREKIVPLATSPQQLEDMVEDMEIPLLFVEPLLKMLAQPDILTDNDIDPHLLKILADANTGCWFCMEGSGKVASTKLGTKPGDPLADILFNLAIVPAIKDLNTQLQDAGFFSPLDVDLEPSDRHFAAAASNIRVLDNDPGGSPSFVDDLVGIATLDHNAPIQPQAQAIAVISHRALSMHGFLTNYDIGKTEQMLSAHSDNKNDIYKDSRHTNNNIVHFGDSSMRNVNVYKHLGGKTPFDGSMGPEVVQRTSAHAKALGPLRKVVHRRIHTKTSTKAALTDSLATSTLLYNAQTWTTLTGQEHKNLTAALTKGYRSAAQMYLHSSRLQLTQAPNLEVMEKVNKPDLTEQIRYIRLMHISRLLQSAPAALLALIDATIFYDTDDAKELRVDFQWVINTNASRLDLPAADNWGEWLQLAQDYKSWRRLVRITAKLALAQRQDQRRLHLWRKQITDIYIDKKVAPPPFAPIAEQEQAFICYQCGESLATTAGWHHHMRSHGQKPLARYYVTDSTCRACNTDYHTIGRVFAHLRGKPQCLVTMADHLEVLTEDQMDTIRQRELRQDHDITVQGFYHRKALVKPLKKQGPVLFCPYNKSQALERKLKPIAVADLPVPQDSLPELASHHAETIFLVPQPQLKVYFALYFCSGQRRPDDFQDHFEKINQQAGLPVMVLSIDIVNDSKIGDLTRKDTIIFWINKFIDGLIVALLGSPPCETWCAGRFHKLEGKPGPRPIRSLGQPWGINGLTLREQRQIDLGNALLRTQILFMHIGALYDIPVVSEHPAPAHWEPQAPSSWYLDEISWLFDEGLADRNFVNQCMLGATALKPTILAAVRLSQLKYNVSQLPNQGLCDRKHKHIKLSGRDADGNFVTAPFKQYQSPLNKLLAQSFIDKLQLRMTPGPVEFESVENIFTRFFVPLDPYYEGHKLGQYGQDCALHTRHMASSPHGAPSSPSFSPRLEPSFEPSLRSPSSREPSRDTCPEMCNCGDCAGRPDAQHQAYAAVRQKQLTEEQLARIAKNKAKAYDIKRGRVAALGRTDVTSSPEDLLAPVSNLIHSAPTTSHRLKFHFGRNSAQSAISHTATSR